MPERFYKKTSWRADGSGLRIKRFLPPMVSLCQTRDHPTGATVGCALARILSCEAESIADLRNCFTEANTISLDDPERSR